MNPIPNAALMRAIDQKDAARVEYLLRTGADANCQSDPRADAPLGHLLATPGASSIAGLQIFHSLIAFGADVNWRYPLRATPLLFSTIGDPKGSDLFRILLRRGGTGGADENGVTALHVAAHCGREDCAAALLAAGAEVDARDKNGVTPLHVAATAQHLGLLLLLCEYGAGLDAFDCAQHTALHRTESDEVFLALLDAGADPHAAPPEPPAPRHYLTPFQHAVRQGMATAAAACLARSDSDLQQRTQDGRSLAALAAASENPAMGELIAAALAKTQLAAGAPPAPRP